MANFKKQIVYIKDENGNIIGISEVLNIYDINKVKLIENDIVKANKERLAKLEEERLLKEQDKENKRYEYYYSKAKIALVANYLFSKAQVYGEDVVIEVYDILNEVLNDKISVEDALEQDALLKEAFTLIFGEYKKGGE